MNLNLFTYFVIIIWIRTIYSQIYVNFRILGKSGDEREKKRIYKAKKAKLESTNTHSGLPKLAQAICS